MPKHFVIILNKDIHCSPQMFENLLLSLQWLKFIPRLKLLYLTYTVFNS